MTRAMKVAIIEDELLAYQELTRMLHQIDPSIEVSAHFQTISEAIKGLPEINADLLFFDISLPDGQSFDILKAVDIDTPIIFTTAYDEFAIKAFDFNSIGYLLKPVDVHDLKAALIKYEKGKKGKETYSYSELYHLLKGKKEKKRFLIKIGDNYSYINIEEIAYFFSEDKTTYLRTFDNSTYITDYTLNDIETLLGDEFFRVARNVICSLSAVATTSKYFNSRLKLQLKPAYEHELLISRVRVKEFLMWMDG